MLAAVIPGCASPAAPTSSLAQPPSIRIGHHIVSKGETLYSIAWRYGRDYRELAALNGISAPYSIYPGQRLKLQGKPVQTVSRPQSRTRPRPQPHPQPRPEPRDLSKPVVTTIASAPVSKAEQEKPKAPVRSKSLTPKPVKKPAATRTAGQIRWQWPVRGKLISRFTSGDPLRKGVDIAGEKGDSVHAAADGTVIYAGSALRGYGNLLIVKHSEEFLSAYAHNHKLLVKEGSAVRAGQRIAELGSSGTSRNKLHFEIRRNGQPVDPMTYLP
ncbi:peptidoglycan DD-metalloendopeptidase family protein [Microbulbifer sp. M83]|nr:peptidoglycan DD-metalloendopeptidase family protein [Microbulbifer zhoushanensis]